MIYGFLDGETIIVSAGTSWTEFETTLMALRAGALETEVPSALELINNPLYDGMYCSPLIIHADHLRGIEIVSREEAIEKQRIMMDSPDSDDGAIDEMYALYEKSTEGEKATVSDALGSFICEKPGRRVVPTGSMIKAEDALISDDPSPEEFLFVTYAMHDVGTVALITSEAFYGEESHRIYVSQFGETGRIGPHIAHFLPVGFGQELVPGCFEYDGSPIAAKKALLTAGFKYDVDNYARNVIAGTRVCPEGNSPQELAEEMGMVMPVAADDFAVGISSHPARNTAFVMIIPRPFYERYGRRCYDTFIEPLVEPFLPIGYEEIAPCIFEVLCPESMAHDELERAGFIVDEDVSGIMAQISSCERLAGEVSQPVTASDQDIRDWNEVAALLPSMDDRQFEELQETLKPGEFIFTVFEHGKFSFLVITPEAYFDEHAEVFPLDLKLNKVLMPQATHIVANTFRIDGIASVPVTALMVKNGFRESFDLMIWVNLALHNGYADVLGIKI